MLENLTRKTQQREGDDRPAPAGTGARVWDMLCNHFFKLLWANLLCVLCCVFLVTIPAAVCGLFAVVQQYYRKGYGDVNGTFFREFKQNFIARVLMTACLIALPVLGLAVGAMINSWVALVGCSLVTAFCLLVLSWLYPQMSLLELQPLQALRNAVLLTALESKRDLLLIVVWAVFGGALLTFWPISMLLLFFLIPIVPVILLHVITEPVLEDRIIGKEADIES